MNRSQTTEVTMKITAADIIAGRASAEEYVAQLSPAKATAAAVNVASGMVERGEAFPDEAGITACRALRGADIYSVRAVLRGQACLRERV
jgi:hypothetical protein